MGANRGIVGVGDVVYVLVCVGAGRKIKILIVDRTVRWTGRKFGMEVALVRVNLLNFWLLAPWREQTPQSRYGSSGKAEVAALGA